MDIKSKSSNNMGDFRRNLLEMASWTFINAPVLVNQTGSLAPYRSVEAHLDSFEITLESGSEAKKDILRAKDDIFKDKTEALQKYEVDKKRLGYFERQDMEQTVERDIEILSVKRRLENCWDVATKRGLFNE